MSKFNYLCGYDFQEFTIEIPDVEADEIQTVAQGTFLYPFRFRDFPLTVSVSSYWLYRENTWR